VAGSGTSSRLVSTVPVFTRRWHGAAKESPHEGHILNSILPRAVLFLLLTGITYTTKKGSPTRSGSPQSMRWLERRIARFRAIAGVRTGRSRWRFRFGAAEPANGIRTHAPERDYPGVSIATGSTVVLDSSGTCDDERRIAVGNALGDYFRMADKNIQSPRLNASAATTSGLLLVCLSKCLGATSPIYGSSSARDISDQG